MVQQGIMEPCAAWVKRTTSGAHQTAEAVMMPLIEGAADPLRYGALLQMQYGFYRPMEGLITPMVNTMTLPDPLFKWSLLIEEDLAVLGMKPAAQSPYLPGIKTEFSALGALYVLEGAALGGRIIARMLQAHDRLPQNAFHFFKGREEATGPHWTRFTRFLNEHVTTETQIKEVGAAAAATFAAYTLWMQTL